MLPKAYEIHIWAARLEISQRVDIFWFPIQHLGNLCGLRGAAATPRHPIS